MSQSEGPQSAPGRRIAVHYLKSSFFRVVAAEGVWGGVTPSLKISMAFWNQRHPIPTKQVFAITDQDTIGEELRPDRETRAGLVREVETEVLMDLHTAREFRSWLDERISALESMHRDAKKTIDE